MHRALVHTSQSSVHLLSEAQLVSQYRRNYICIFYPLSYLDQLPRIGHCSLLSDLIHYCSFGVAAEPPKPRLLLILSIFESYTAVIGPKKRLWEGPRLILVYMSRDLCNMELKQIGFSQRGIMMLCCARVLRMTSHRS